MNISKPPMTPIKNNEQNIVPNNKNNINGQ